MDLQKVEAYLASMGQADGPIRLDVSDLPLPFKEVRVGGHLLEVAVNEDGTPRYSQVQRSFAKAAVAEGDERYPAVKDFVRGVLEEMKRKLDQTLNGRDSSDSSSLYGIGVPYIPMSPSALRGNKGLKPNEVGVDPITARRMGWNSGELVIVRRFPETNVLMMRLRTVYDLGEGLIALAEGVLSHPLYGDMFSVNGGDCDGDCYVITKIATPACQKELAREHNRFWAAWKERYALRQSGVNYSYLDEQVKGEVDQMAVLQDKFLQKAAIRPVALDAYCIGILATKGVISSSLEDVRLLCERMIEVTMDLKKATGQDPLLCHRLFNEAKGAELTAETREALEGQGAPINVIEEVLSLLWDRDPINDEKRFTSIREKVERLTAVWGALKGDAEWLEQIWPRNEADTKSFVQRFLTDAYGRARWSNLRWQGTFKMPPAAKIGHHDGINSMKLTVSVSDDRNQLAVACEYGDKNPEGVYPQVSITYPLMENGSMLELTSHRRILLRPTVYVPWDITWETRGGRRVPIEAFAGSPASATIWTDWGCQLHDESGRPLRWPKKGLLATLIYLEKRYELDAAKAAKTAPEAEEHLRNAVQGALQKMLASYECDSEPHEWATIAGMAKVLLLDIDLPSDLSGCDRITLGAQRSLSAATALLNTVDPSTGLPWIRSATDTTSGTPGMAWYRQTKPGKTKVSETFVLPQFAPAKRSPVLNAPSNLVELDLVRDGGTTSFSVPENTAPVREVFWVAMPFDMADSVMVNEGVAPLLTAKTWNRTDETYELHPFTNGSKCQALEADIKGVAQLVPNDCMPWLKFGDGPKAIWVKAQLISQLGSLSHQQLRQTHLRAALEMRAVYLRAALDKLSRIHQDATVEEIVSSCTKCGLYKDSSLTAEVWSADMTTKLGDCPAGVVALGVHRQFPEVVVKGHRQSKMPTDWVPAGFKDGGSKQGWPGALAMRANGLFEAVKNLHSEVPQRLQEEIQDIARALGGEGGTKPPSKPGKPTKERS